jgi:transposase-like protein
LGKTLRANSSVVISLAVFFFLGILEAPMKRVRQAKPKQEIDLVKLIALFHSEEKCRARLEELRWPDGPQCTRCQSKQVYRQSGREQLYCGSCDYQFSVTAGTIFHDSHLPLPKWFLAIYLMCESKKGISANQMKRTLGVSYKTAWYLCHRIRAALKEANPIPLKGIVELDETFIGGHRKGVGKGNRIGKTLVVGAVERGGNIRLRVERRNDRKTLHRFVKEHCSPDTEAFMTDTWYPYLGIADADTRHETVNHELNEWVRGDVHTNTVEGVWSLFKRSIVGAFHQVSAKHLDAYLDEFEFRFNNRDNPHLFRDILIKLLESDKLEYKELIGSE